MRKSASEPRFKLQRRLLTELPGLGKAGALERRPYPPGQHGGKRIKYSDFRLQLEEKQKLRVHYGLREEQMLRLVKNAKKQTGEKWIANLANILEKRLENIIFRAGFAQSIRSAAQMISHGQVLVNGLKVNIRSAKVRKGDTVSLTTRGVKNQIYINAKQSPRLPLPDWLKKNETDTLAEVTLIDEPTLQSVPFYFNESLVVSYYSKA